MMNMAYSRKRTVRIICVGHYEFRDILQSDLIAFVQPSITMICGSHVSPNTKVLNGASGLVFTYTFLCYSFLISQRRDNLYGRDMSQ